MKKKRILVISDLHCGHHVGLTPPGFDPDEPPPRKTEMWKMRRAVWDWFVETTNAIGKVDALLVNGDAIEGKAEKSGGTELLYPDRNDQVEMAVAAIRHIRAGDVLMSYGTPYHTGRLEDWEDAVAREIKATKIGGEDNIEVNGLIINYRHKVGRSSIPHGRHTAVAKERLWNLLWAERGEFPKADVIIRSHVHYYDFCGGADWLGLTTPALQGYGGKFGTREVSGTINIGLVYFDVWAKDNYTWTRELLKFDMDEPLSL